VTGPGSGSGPGPGRGPGHGPATGGALPAPSVLECTLRDGSYAVDFQFSPQDTALVARVLEEAGAGLIEIGHGLGLGASRAGKGRAAASDAGYMEAASQALEKAAWGMFCIPGVARLEDLELAASLGMGFVRVGVNPSRTAEAAPFLARASELGLRTFANIMKSYVLAPGELADKARELAGLGAGGIYVVDSAGCMLPEAVGEAVRAVALASGLPVGFHGHDNLRLAVANCLAAWRAGASWLDATLHGVGRGGGNAATEVLAAALECAGAPSGLDCDALLDAGRALLGPLASGAAGLSGLALTGGRCGLHSSFFPLAEQAAREFGVDRRELIRAVSRVNREDPDQELFRREARALASGPPDVLADASADAPPGARPSGQGGGARLWRLPSAAFPPEDQTSGSHDSEADADASVDPGQGSALASLGARVRSRARLTGRKAVMNVYSLPQEQPGTRISPFVQEGAGYVIGSLRTDEAGLPGVIAALDGVVDIFFVDAERKPHQGRALYGPAAALAGRSRVLAYSDGDVWVRAVAAQIAWHRKGAAGVRVALLDASPLALRTALALAGQGAVIVAPREVAELARAALSPSCLAPPEIEAVDGGEQAAATAGVLLAFEPERIGASLVLAAPDGALVMDAGIGSVTREGLETAQARDIPVLRPDMRAMLAAELRAALGARRWLAGSGRGELAGQPVVAGGLVGRRGDILLDSLSRPTQVIGVADGRGRALDERGEFAPRLRLVRGEVLRRLLSGEDAD